MSHRRPTRDAVRVCCYFELSCSAQALESGGSGGPRTTPLAWVCRPHAVSGSLAWVTVVVRDRALAPDTTAVDPHVAERQERLARTPSQPSASVEQRPSVYRRGLSRGPQQVARRRRRLVASALVRDADGWKRHRRVVYPAAVHSGGGGEQRRRAMTPGAGPM